MGLKGALMRSSLPSLRCQRSPEPLRLEVHQRIRARGAISCDKAAAAKAYREAKKSNPHVVQYLIGDREKRVSI